MGDLIKDLEREEARRRRSHGNSVVHPTTTTTFDGSPYQQEISWSDNLLTNTKSRSRTPLHLTPANYDDNDVDVVDPEGSLSNILDAYGETITILPSPRASSPWLQPPTGTTLQDQFYQNHTHPRSIHHHQSNEQGRFGHLTNRTPQLTQLIRTLTTHYEGLIRQAINSCPPHHKSAVGVPGSIRELMVELKAGPHPQQQNSSSSSTVSWLTSLPGQGKTNYLLNILQDWLDTQSKTELLIYIPLRSINSVSTYIKSIGAQTLLNSTTNLTLLLDDVSSNLPPPLLNEVQDLLNKTTLKDAKLICSTSCSRIINNLQSNLVYSVAGLTWDARVGIITKYLGETRAKYELINYINSNSEELSSTADGLTLLLTNFDGGGERPWTHQPKVDLYRSVVSSLCSQSPTSKLDKLQVQMGRLLHHHQDSYYKDSDLSRLQNSKHGLFKKVSSAPVKYYRLVQQCLRPYLISTYLSSLDTNFKVEFTKLQDPDQVLPLLIDLLSRQDKLELLFSSINLLEVPLEELLTLKCTTTASQGHYTHKICGLLKRNRISTLSATDPTYSAIINSASCPLDKLELLLNPNQDGQLISAIVNNTSIKALTLSSVPGQEWSHPEINSISHSISQILNKNSLEDLSIKFTLLREEEHSTFQPIVDSVSFNLPKSSLKSLTIELDLTQLQLVQIIEASANLTRLNLPNLAVSEVTLERVGELARGVCLQELSLVGCWRRDSDYHGNSTARSNSSHSSTMGSQGPSTTSIKSTATTNLFRHLFIKSSNLSRLNLSKSSLSLQDLGSLSDYIRTNNKLRELLLNGMRLVDVMAVLLALDQNNSLELLSISSSHVLISDESICLVAEAMGRNSRLRKLSLAGWVVNVEDPLTLTNLTSLLTQSQMESIDLGGCSINVNCSLPSSATSPSSGSSSTLRRGLSLFSSTLNLSSSTVSTLLPQLKHGLFSGVSINFKSEQQLSSCPQLQIMSTLSNKSLLTKLDLSASRVKERSTTTVAGATSLIEAKSFIRLIRGISTFTNLESLVVNNYKLRVGGERELAPVRQLLGGLVKLSCISLEGVEVSVATREAGSRSSISRVDNWLLNPIVQSINSDFTIRWGNYEPVDSIRDLDYSPNWEGAELRLELSSKGEELKRLLRISSNLSYEGSVDTGALILKGSGKSIVKSMRRLF